MLNRNNKSKESGFTIIEVMIVLAIAGLIMLIVFMAVPALQRNSRNTQRKNDVQAVLGGVSTYTSNNNGALPANFAAVETEVKTSFYVTADVTWGTGNTAIATPDTSFMYVNTGAKCNATGDNFGGSGATRRSVAILYALETGSGTTMKCQSS
jgi:prepilin-type N-terminal cleavage/methylation domain-containing protein